MMFTTADPRDPGAERVWDGTEFLGSMWWDYVDGGYAIQYPGGRIVREAWQTRRAAAYALQGRSAAEVAAANVPTDR
jgi:hypothetical protein